MRITTKENRQESIQNPNKDEYLLSDGTEIIIFFEYYKKSLQDPGKIKEIITKKMYLRIFDFNEDCLYSETTGIIYQHNNPETDYSLSYPSKEQIKHYLKNLKPKNLYTEYAEKLFNFYNTATQTKIKNKRKIK